MSRKIKYGFGSRGDWHDGVIEVPDDATDADIDEIVIDEMLEVFDYTWSEVAE